MRLLTTAVAALASAAALPALARAHCPLCTAATGALVVTSRFYGIDDLAVSTFIGAFVVSTALWANRMLKKRNNGRHHITFQPAVLVLLSLALTIWGFQTGGLTGVGMLLGIDKIAAGMVIGSAMTIVAFKANGLLRAAHGGRHFVPFQVIVITVALLAATVAGYYVTGVAV